MTADSPGDLPGSVDVAVIGGGIQGAGIAQAAAAAGYSVVLVEKTGWASATSSKSSKLIHGGLRYLKQGQLGLVRESLRERAILCRIAPHLVHLNNFHIPVYRDSDIRPLTLWAGLSLYALLAGLGSSSRFQRVHRRHWHQLDGLRTDKLEAVFRYRDGQTDDLLLTRAVVASARQLGTHLACPVEFVAAVGRGDGYRVELASATGPATLHCRVLVNAAGPWLAQVAQRIDPAPTVPALSLIQGSHLVLESRLSDSCYYLESPEDGRPVFALPWHGRTLLGTTETPYQGDPAMARCLPGEEAYLLATLCHYFPHYGASAQVIDRMAGLRVLPGGGPLASRPRDVMIQRDVRDGAAYVGVCGGKLTGYRSTAARVADILARHLGRRRQLADTATLRLPEP